MNKLFYLYLFFIVASCETPADKGFNIIRFDISNQKDSISYENWKKENRVIPNSKLMDSLTYTDGTLASRLFYEDDDYKAYMDCQGEFGGSIYFQDKRDKNSFYYLETVCPVMIEKKTEGYYIVETLAHMGRYGRISFIESPSSLIKVNLKDLSPNWKSERFPGLSYYKINDKLRRQSKTIIGGLGLTFNMIFHYNEKSYTIYSKNEITLLGEIIQDSIVTIDTLFFYDSYGRRDNYKYKVNNYLHYEYLNQNWSIDTKTTEKTKTEGEIYVNGKNIICAYSFRNWTIEN